MSSPESIPLADNDAETPSPPSSFPTLFSDGAAPPLIDVFHTPPSISTATLPEDIELEHEEWYDFDVNFELFDLFETSQRRQAIAQFRQRLHDRFRTQITPYHILLRDKVTFTVGTLDLLASAYWLGVSPRTFYKLFSVKAVLLLLIRWVYYRVKKWHYYMFDLCYAVQILILLNVWVFPTSITLSKVVFAFSLGPLLWSILAFRNSLVYHSLDKVTSLFLHFFPACVAWAHRFHPPQSLELSLVDDLARRARWDAASPFELCFLPMGPYLLWAVLYGLKIFVISSEKIQQRQYETLFNYVTTRRGFFATVVLRFPPKMQPLVYLSLHMVLTQLVMFLNTLWWSSETAALCFIISAFTLAAWHGASYYFDHFAHRYVAALGLEPKQKGKGAVAASDDAPHIEKPFSDQSSDDASFLPQQQQKIEHGKEEDGHSSSRPNNVVYKTD